MSVVLETTLGDITVDLFVKERPNACLNFLKLCRIKYYNLCIFHKVERNFIAQTGDPTSTGRGGESVFSHVYGEQAKYFDAETKPRLKHEKLGTLSMVNNGNGMNGSQFFLTLGENITYLDEVHTVFGEVVEGFDILLKINEAICDPDNRPYQDIRITHTVVLHDPYEDPPGLEIPDASPEPTREQLESNYIGADEEIDDTKGKNAEEIEEKIKESEAKARATILEMVGDIPDVDVKPPENVLFVCKLNPVTTSEDLEIIFSRFGPIVSCEVIKDKTSGESLQYAFIEFENEEDCENAYFKMDNVLIDDRRIHVDFSQSVSKLNWNSQNKFPKQGSGRFQNFLIKDRDKRSDGYEMIFDMEKASTGNKRTDKKDRNRSTTRRNMRYSPEPRSDKRHTEHFPSQDKYKQNDKYFKDDETSYKKSTYHSRNSKSDRVYNSKEFSSKEKSRPRDPRSPAKQKSNHDSALDSKIHYKRSFERKQRHDSSSSTHSSSLSPIQKVQSLTPQRSKENSNKKKQDSYTRVHSSSPESYSKKEHSFKQKHKSQSRSFEKHMDKNKRATKENPSYRQSGSISPEISNSKTSKQMNRHSFSTSPESLHRKRKEPKSFRRRSQSRSPENSKKQPAKHLYHKSPSPPDSYREKKSLKSSYKQSPSRSFETTKRKTEKHHKSPSTSPEPSYGKKTVSKRSNRRSQSRSPEKSKSKSVKQTYRSPSTSPESANRKRKKSKNVYRSQSRSPVNSGRKTATREYSKSPSTSPEYTSPKKKASRNSHRSESRSPENFKKKTAKQAYHKSPAGELSHKRKKASKSSYTSRSRSPNFERKSSKHRYNSRSPESSRQKKNKM